LWSSPAPRSIRRFRPWPTVRPSLRSTVQAAAATETVAEKVSAAQSALDEAKGFVEDAEPSAGDAKEQATLAAAERRAAASASLEALKPKVAVAIGSPSPSPRASGS